MTRAPIPQNVRHAVYLRSEMCCEECGNETRIELHHLAYDDGPPDFEPIFGRETPDVLEALCRDCHLARHLGPAGQFYRDPIEAQGERDHFMHLLLSDHT